MISITKTWLPKLESNFLFKLFMPPNMTILSDLSSSVIKVVEWFPILHNLCEEGKYLTLSQDF